MSYDLILLSQCVTDTAIETMREMEKRLLRNKAKFEDEQKKAREELEKAIQKEDDSTIQLETPTQGNITLDEVPLDDRIIAWRSDSFVIHGTFYSANELRELADSIDKYGEQKRN